MNGHKGRPHIVFLAVVHGFWALTTESLQTDSIYALIPEFWIQAKWMPLHGALLQLFALTGLDPELVGRLLSALAATTLWFPVQSLASRIAGGPRYWAVTWVLAFTPLVGRYAGLVLNDLVFCLWLLLALSSFVLHGRHLPLWVTLAILTRPEGWGLLPMLVLWHVYARGGLWISALGLTVAICWMWGRRGSFVLGQEFAGGVLGADVLGWAGQALATLVLVLAMAWPALLCSRARFETALIVLIPLLLLLWILPSLTATWSGRRALPLIVLLAPWTALGLGRSRSLSGVWLALSLAGCVAVAIGLRREHGDLKEACLYVCKARPTGTVYVDDIRRCQWWLKSIPLERVRVWKGEKAGPHDALVLWNRRRELPPEQVFSATSKTLNIFGDGIWLKGGEFVSQEPPGAGEWGRWSTFESRVYLPR